MLETALLYAATTLYLAAAAWAVVRLVRTSDTRGRGPLLGPEGLLVAALLALLGLLVARGVGTGSFPATNTGESLALFSLAIGAFCLAFGRTPENRSVGAFVLPAGAALSVSSAVWFAAAQPDVRAFNAVFLGLHATSCFAAYAALAVGCGAGIAYLIQERALKRKTFGAISRHLPSLHTLDLLSYRAVTIGFPLLTFGMAVGSVWAGRVWGSYWLWEPKLTLTLMLWLLWAAVFHLRTIERYQGRRTALLAVISAVMVVAVFLGAGLLPGGRHAFL